jgi:PEP-utilising enzyme, PEP-binding domain/PTS system fructose IIA component/PTS HPr component phosphorylation site
LSIKEAIERVDGPAGVVVLMDLGSAVLSAELALDLIADASIRDRVTLTAAPIVEGLVVAAVAAAGGASRAEVAAEARGALLGKAAHLSSPAETGAPEPGPVGAAEIVAVFTIENPHGLRARPAARLVGELRGLDATVALCNLTAAERGNAGVAALSDALDPGVLQLIDHVCRAALGRADVAVCGEAASDELAIPVLVGLGIRELSVSPYAVPRVKAAIGELDVGRCVAMAQDALTLAGADDVRKLVLTTMSETTG